MLIQALSFVLGTYALVICVKLAARHLPQHALRRKFTVFHLHYTVTRLQVGSRFTSLYIPSPSL